MSFTPATRKQQKTIYAFINQYALYLAARGNKATPSDYFAYLAKKELKRLFLEVTKEVRTEEPLQLMRDKIKIGIFEYTEELAESGECKEEELLDLIDGALREFIEDLASKLAPSEAFSLALSVMSKERAKMFIQYLIDYFLDNEIGLGKELHDMIIEGEHDRFIYAMLRNKKCAVCGSEGVDLHHWISAGALGGYDKDRGQGEYISLCRKHHTEEHEIGHIVFFRKYKKRGIKLTEEQVKELKKIYKNHFKGAKI